MKTTDEVYFIDASVWVGLSLREDAHHERAVMLTKNLLHDVTLLVTSDYVIDESATRIKKKDGAKTAKAFLAFIKKEQITFFAMTKRLFEESVSIFNNHPQPSSFSFTDASIVALMRHHKIRTLLTFDSDFKKLEKKLNIKILP